MGQIIIQEETTKNPITLIGKEAGICWGSDTSSDEKNYKRGLECIKNNHGRTLEYPQVYMVIDEYSARVIREYYTANGGFPSRLQSSTRYIKYGGFEYVTPPSVLKHELYADKYKKCMTQISESIKELIDLGVPVEDANMLLPLGMTTKVVVRTNPRQLIDMSRQRMCSRAYWEFRKLMTDMCRALSEYSEEWGVIVNECFHAKCDEYGYCTESKGCGRYPHKSEE